ncbi:MAG: PilZ domain-containing protein [Pseudomonadota bacterium]|nr:PilZ domain-containing protein [Pseudomonadota bacterium]
MNERREFSRVLFSCPAILRIEGNDYHCQLLDLSLQGALITKSDSFLVPIHSKADLIFTLPESTIEIKMQVELCHVEHQHAGLRCEHIDIDSITHLKRLIELNLGDEALLHRELAHLIHAPE